MCKHERKRALDAPHEKGVFNMLENAKRKLEIEVKEACERIIKSERRDEMLYHYFGAAYVTDFALDIGIITLEEHQKYGNMLDEAHDKYYENAKKDFEKAHKRIF